MSLWIEISKDKEKNMRYFILAEVRENYPSLINGENVYNDYVSKKSMLDLCDALNSMGYNCTFFGGIKELLRAYQNNMDTSNIIFINYNYGLPATFKRTQCPTLLELMNAQYSGSDPFVSLLVNDKEYTKKVLRSNNILTPASFLVSNSCDLINKLHIANIPMPIVVKPNCEGSSLGITDKCLCNSYEDCQNVVNMLLKDFGEVIIEQYIPGYECTVWVIGNANKFHLVAPLLISENGTYYFKHKIFTMQDKANRVRQYHLANDIFDTEMVNQIKHLSETIFTELRLRDYARFDFRIFDENIYFIEANALPIFSKSSEIGKISQLYKISYKDICKLFIETINNRLMAKTD